MLLSIASFFMSFWPFMLAFAGLLVAGFVFIVVIPQMHENKVKRVFQSLAEPKIFWQNSPEDKDYLANFEREQMRYISSGNRLALVQTPVILFPRNTEFEFEWFGVIYRPSTVGLNSEEEYMRAGFAFYKKMKAIWDKELGEAFGTREMIRMTQGQRVEVLTDDADIWG